MIYISFYIYIYIFNPDFYSIFIVDLNPDLNWFKSMI